MYKKEIQYIYPIKSFNNFLYLVSNSYVSIKNIYNKNILNYNLIKNISFLYKLYINLSHRRKTKQVKTISKVSKSNKKPWPQKKLGKARAGSFKSPLWRGGGIIFGPISKVNKIKINKKLKKFSIMYILLNKRSQIHFIYFYSLIHSFKTFDDHIKQQLRINGIFSNKILIITLKKNMLINISCYKTVTINTLTIKDIIYSDFILFLI